MIEKNYLWYDRKNQNIIRVKYFRIFIGFNEVPDRYWLATWNSNWHQRLIFFLFFKIIIIHISLCLLMLLMLMWSLFSIRSFIHLEFVKITVDSLHWLFLKIDSI